MNKFLMIFLDGVGIGEEKSLNNPFFTYRFSYIKKYFSSVPHINNANLNAGDKYIFPVNATMGVEGIPQSGTGQSSMLTGKNTSKILGNHFGPFVHSTLHKTLEEENLFAELKKKGARVCFANSYPKIYFDFLDSGKKRIGAFAYSAILSKVKLNTLAELRAQKSLSNDITNERWRTQLGYNVDVLQPEQSAANLLKLTQNNELTVFEYYLTDHIGHGRIKEERDKLLCDLDRFLVHLFDNIDSETTMLICSDHGNMEDLSVKSHTFNDAMFYSAGKYSKLLQQNIKFLYDTKWAIKDIILK